MSLKGSALSRYSLVGILNTLLHWLVLAGLVSWFGMGSAAANLLAFLVAATFGFWCHVKWTFRQTAGLKRYLRFVALMGALAFGCGWLAQAWSLHFTFAALFFSGISWLLGFLGTKFWIFGADDAQH